jgi:hypothetical protein
VRPSGKDSEPRDLQEPMRAEEMGILHRWAGKGEVTQLWPKSGSSSWVATQPG